MADAKISALTDGTSPQSGDQFAVARSGANKSLTWLEIQKAAGVYKLYDYTVSGSDKASIDTQVDDGGNGAAALPTTYSVLEVWIIARTDDAAAFHDIDMTLNNDTSSIYDRLAVQAVGASAGTATGYADSKWSFQVHGSGGTSGYAGVTRLTIAGYGGTTFNKTAEATGSTPDGTTGNDIARAQILGYRSTSAISRMKIAGQSTAKLKVGSRLLIFGRT